METYATSNPETQRSPPPTARLRLTFLGTPRVIVEDLTVLGLNTPRTLALLAYLAVEPHRPHERSTLATLFWPDQSEKQAFQNLRQSLSRLRQAIEERPRSGTAGAPHLLVSRETVQFNSASSYWLDVEALKLLLAETRRHPHRRLDVCPVCLAQLVEAADLYRGEFMDGFFASDSLALDEWLLIEREGLRQQTCVALHALARAHHARGEHRAAYGYARRLLRLDPWNEATQRLAMRALALGEGRNPALQHYHTFRHTLNEELGVEPEAETAELVALIETGELSEPSDPPSTWLPAPTTPFVGREVEIAAIHRHLAGREPRVLTLYGPGGCGKTRLALEAAAAQMPLWRDGIWFVPLVDVASPQALVEAVANTLGIAEREAPLKIERLLTLLRARELLLILDGFEHLADGAAILKEIVHWAPDVHLLVTSRVRLGIEGELALPLGGLEVPPALPPLTETEAAPGIPERTYSAVRLFADSARRIAPDFSLTDENLPDVVRICRLVEGLPLGIQLAATWVRLYRCRQIADEIEDSLDFLQLPGVEAPQGRHSLRGAFEYSYALLSEAEQKLFRRLSVFRGGFEVKAARHVVEADPFGLDALLDKSLLQVAPFDGSEPASARRLDLHLTLRQYAAEKLAAAPEEEAVVRTRHSRFFLAFLMEWEMGQDGRGERAMLDGIRGDIANVRAAWEWAVGEGEIDALGGALPSLARFYNRSGRFEEGEQVFRSTAERLFGSDPAPDAPVAMHMLGRLQAEQARFLYGLGDYARVLEHAQAAAALAAACQDPALEAQAALFRGYVYHHRSDLEKARTCFERALALSRLDPPGPAPLAASRLLELEANSLNGLATVCKRQGKYDDAEHYLTTSLQAARQAHDLAGQCRAWNGLGSSASRRGDLSQALSSYQEALRCARACNDRRLEGSLLNNAGNIYLRTGFYAEAGSHYRASLEIQRAIGARQSEISARFNLGLVHHHLGDHPSARSYLRQALELARALEDRRAQAFAWLGLGHVHLALGAPEQAYDAYQTSLALRRDLGQAHLLAEPLAGMAQSRLDEGAPEAALAHAEEILAYLASGGTLEGAISPFQVYLTCIRILEANRDARATGLARTAHDMLQERAQRIVDDAMRRSFLDNVAEHRELARAVAS